MRKFIFIILFSVSSILSYAQAYNYFGTFNSLGVPNYLTPVSDTIPPILLANIASSLPESFPVPIYHPQYIASGSSTNILMQSGGDVWVTFVDEGAGYKNVLGYYSYPQTSPPATIPANNQMKIIFPNVSKLNSGGGLLPGHKVFLGHFDAGTVISWFLIADGYRNGAVTAGNWRLFSNSSFNPETNPLLKAHNVLLYDSVYNKVILGFEDIRRDNSSCDNDFNDAIFYVSCTPDTAIATNSMNKTFNSSPNVSTGNSGGLESNGGLSELISKRNFVRQKKLMKDEKSHQVRMNYNTKNRSELASFIPSADSVHLSGYISTPDDLIQITNAIDIIAVDYYDTTNERQGVVLVTKTLNKVYNHTKSICDRLKNASLMEITEQTYAGISFITYLLKQADDKREYVTCFSISDENNEFTIHNQWLIGQYPKKETYYNFQIWTAMPHVNQYLVEQVLSKVAAIRGFQQDTTSKKMPSAYFIKGDVNGKDLRLDIKNNGDASNAQIVLNYTNSEVESRKQIKYPIAITPHSTSSVKISLEGFFDADIQLEINGEIVDEMYLADGAWGTDYDASNTDLLSFDVRNDDIKTEVDEYAVSRSASCKVKTAGYITLFKAFKASNMTIDLRDYQYINLDIQSSKEVYLRLNKKSIQDWTQQASCKLPIQGNSSKVSIPLSAFRNDKGEIVSMNDVLSFSSTLNTNGDNAIEYEMGIQHLSFSKMPMYTLFSPSSTLTVHPNPVLASDSYTIQFNKENAGDIIIRMISMKGDIIDRKAYQVTSGNFSKTIQLNQNTQPGNYIIEVVHQNKTESILLTVK